jgi:putative SOS response-associated peptidase YedK
MCTRYLLERSAAEAGFKKLGLDALAAAVAKAMDRFNIAPGTEILALRAGERPGTARIFAPRWGFAAARTTVGSASTDAGSVLVNARGETAAEKPSFREAWRSRRCLVPATGFYEWEKRGRARLPWLFRRVGGEPFAFAGLWETREDGGAAAVLVTTTANSLLAQIHDRMPVMLVGADACRGWLSPDAPESALGALLAPLEASEMQATPVSPRVNRSDFDSPECVRPVVHGLAPRDAAEGGPELGF